MRGMEQEKSGAETGAAAEPEVETWNVASKFVRRERRDFEKELGKCSEKEEDFQMTKSATKSEKIGRRESDPC